MTVGIYILEFQGTTQVYVGLSRNIEKRYKDHLFSFNKGTSSRKLQSAFNTYGTPTFKILTECEVEELEYLEKEAISLYDSIESGFNSAEGGSTGGNNCGDSNGRSIYSDSQIIEAFSLLDSGLTYQQIADKCGISKAVVTNIKNGISHKWLKDLYPDKYIDLVEHKIDGRISASIATGAKYRTAKARGITYPPVISPDGIIYNIECLSYFCVEHNLKDSGMCSMLKGRVRKYKGWRVYNG